MPGPGGRRRRPGAEVPYPGGDAAMTRERAAGREPASRDPLSLFRLAGQSIVVTGASGALGAAVAGALGALGARLTLASGSPGALAAAAGHAREAGGEVATVDARPDSEADVARIFAAA